MAKPSKNDSMGDHMLALAIASTGDCPIEIQEAQGQRQLNQPNAPVGEGKAVTLPTTINSDRDGSEGHRSILESWGFVFGEPHSDDPIFCDGKLPVGWDMKPSDHSMWSYIYDEEGRERVSIFYKAAFYDRDAFLNVNGRFRTQKDYLGEGDDQYKPTSPIRVTVTDQETGETQVLEGPNRETDDKQRAVCEGLVEGGNWHHPKHWSTEIKTAWERIGTL